MNAVPGRARSVVAFLVYAGAVLGAGGLLAHPLHQALTAVGLDPPELHRLTFRLLKLLALLGLFPLLAALGSGGPAAWGLGGGRSRRAREVLFGLGLGLASMTVVFGILVVAGVREPSLAVVGDASALARLLARALVVAALVACFEELWFRGGLLTVLRGAGGTTAAVAVTAVLYGLVHFVRPDLPVGTDAGWTGGFSAIGGGFGRFGNDAFVDSLPALVMAGWLLGWLRATTGRIFTCVGLHAGWVAVIQVGRGLSEPAGTGPWSWMAGGYDGVIGPLALVVFVLAWLGLRRHFPARVASPL